MSDKGDVNIMYITTALLTWAAQELADDINFWSLTAWPSVK